MAVNETIAIEIEVDTRQLQKIGDTLKSVKSNIEGNLKEAEKKLSTFGKGIDIAKNLSGGFTDGIKSAVNAMRSEVQRQGFSGIGEAIGSKIKSGIQSTISGVGSIISGVTNTIKGAFGALTSLPGLIGIAAGGFAIRDIISASANAEQQQQRFNQTLENTAVNLIATKQGITDLTDEQRELIMSSDEFINTEKQYKSVLDDVGKSARKLGFDDEAAQVSFSRLLQTTKDSTSAQKALSTAFDLSRQRGISLEQSTLLVTRAMTGGGAILKRYGIQLEKGATGAQALDALQKQVAGSAENATKTFAVQQQILGEAIGNIKEDLGQGLTTALGGVLVPISTELNKLITSGVFEKVGTQIGTFVTGAFQVLAPIVQKVINFFVELGTKIGEWLKKIPPETIQALKTAFDQLVLTLSNLLGGITGNSDGVSNLALIIASFITGLVLAITKVIEFTNMLINLGIQVGTFTVNAINSLMNFFNQVKGFFTGLIDSAYNFGVNLINSFVNGIKSVGNSIRNTISSFLPKFDLGGLALPTFATGGQVNGSGTSTSDSILARLSNGEFVVNANATKQFLPLLNAINSNTKSMHSFRGYSGGGVVNKSLGGISINISSNGNPSNIANAVSSQLTSMLKSRGYSI